MEVYALVTSDKNLHQIMDVEIDEVNDRVHFSAEFNQAPDGVCGLMRGSDYKSVPMLVDNLTITNGRRIWSAQLLIGRR